MLWVSPWPRDDRERKVAGDPVNVLQVKEIESQFFQVPLRKPGTAPRRWGRLIFPSVLPVGVDDKVYQKCTYPLSIGTPHWPLFFSHLSTNFEF